MMKYVRRIALGALALVLVLLVVLGAIGAAYEPELSIPPGLAGRHVQVGGVALRVLQRGSGRDVLLIHGSSGCIEDWNPVLDQLARDFRVTAYDRPGHGYSADSGSYSPAYNAQIASSLIAQLGLQQVIVAGHSYGGSTALALAVSGEAAVAGYVIVDSAAYQPIHRADPSLALIAPPWVGIGVASLIGPRIGPARVRATVGQMFEGGPPPPGFLDLRARLFSTPKVLHALAIESRGASGWLAEQSPRYPAIRKPLHIVSQADDARRRATAERLHREIPGSTLRLVPRTGHYVQVERPDEVLAVIRAAAVPTTDTAIGSAGMRPGR